jgi:8-oxo-dGTP diphosphatase
METIHKIGAIILKDRKLLVGRKKDTYIIPGGKIEVGERPEECLSRELQEEFQLSLINSSYFGTYEDEAALDPGMKIKMEIYLVNCLGKPIVDNEIEEMHFISSDTSLKLGSVLSKFVIPKLVEKDLIR